MVWLCAGGENWAASAGSQWGSGDACEAAWSGVTCCPNAQLELGDSLQHALTESGSRAARNVTIPSNATQQAGSREREEVCYDRTGDNGVRRPVRWDGAASGPYARGAVDCAIASDGQSTCGVVKLDLAGRNLRGTLPDSMCALLDHLQRIDLSNNSLVGALPGADERDLNAWRREGGAHGCLPSLEDLIVNSPGSAQTSALSGPFPRWLIGRMEVTPEGYAPLRRLHLPDNSLTIPHDVDLRRIAQACAHKIDCLGLPPVSCSAFGPGRFVADLDGSGCVECKNDWGWALALLLAVGVLGALAMRKIFAIVSKRKTLVRRYIATVLILVAHLQILSLIGSMRLTWPPLVSELYKCVAQRLFSTSPRLACVPCTRAWSPLHPPPSTLCPPPLLHPLLTTPNALRAPPRPLPRQVPAPRLT